MLYAAYVRVLVFPGGGELVQGTVLRGPDPWISWISWISWLIAPGAMIFRLGAVWGNENRFLQRWVHGHHKSMVAPPVDLHVRARQAAGNRFGVRGLRF